MKSSVYIFLFLLLFIAGCMDQFTPRKNIPGPYYIEENEIKGWSLYYDLGDAGHGRMYNLDSIGWTEKFIFSVSDYSYFCLDKTKDTGMYNDNEIVIGPFNRNTYLNYLDSLSIKDFKFQFDFK